MYKLTMLKEHYVPPIHQLVTRTNMVVDLVNEMDDEQSVVIISDVNTDEIVHTITEFRHPGNLRRQLRKFIEEQLPQGDTTLTGNFKPKD